MICNIDKEFEKYSELHSKMVFALALTYEPELYNHPLFQKINNYPNLEGKKRMSSVINELHSLKGKKIFNQIYTVCWSVAEGHVDEKGFFNNRIY